MPVEAIAQVLRGLDPVENPNLLVGSRHFDDAGVYKLDASTALVQTLDFFPPLVDDPYTFGRIAAANSLSDVYAMGGKPLTAMNIVGFPDKELPLEILSQILRGGSERVSASGAVLVGGHSVRDAEIKYGLSVTGIVHPDKILANEGAQVGDKLVLTKPIGSGVLTSAAKANKISENDLAEAIDVMIDLNRGASDAATEFSASAATDITGFGLIGHAHEMAAASDVTLIIEAASVPLLAQTLALAKQGFLTRAYAATLSYLNDRLDIGQVDETLVQVLADAQTSGGLLIAVAPDHADRLVAKLKENQTRSAVIIGTIENKSQHTVALK